MTTEQDTLPFRVAVEAGFDEVGVWIIDARSLLGRSSTCR